MATYTYNISDDQIVLEVEIDKHTLAHFPMEKKYENYEQTKAICLANYVNEHFSLIIGDKKLAFELEGSEQDDHVFILRMVTKGDFTVQEEQIVENDCFYDYDAKFSNRLVVRRDGEIKRTYRLNQSNNIITVKKWKEI